MINERMLQLGEAKSDIRELYEFGLALKKERGEEHVFDFSLGNPSAPPPQEVTEELLRLIRETPPELLHGYTSAPGAFDVREAVAHYIETTFGVPMSADLVYLTCGASASLVAALSAVLQPGEEVIIPSPYFPEYTVFVEAAGGKLVPVETDKAFHLDLGKIAAAITEKTRAVLYNSPNNPTGAVYSDGEILGLGELLRKKSAEFSHPILLISDEPYRELTYVHAPLYPMRAYENTLVLYSFSKSLTLAGERIGYIAVSPRCERAQEVFSAICGAGRHHGYVCAPALFQKLIARCIGATSDIAVYRQSRDLFYKALSDMGYACIVPEGAFYLFVQSPEPDAKAFSERAKTYGILVVPSDSFGVKGYVRISYCVPRAVIERSLPAFEALLASYRKSDKD